MAIGRFWNLLGLLKVIKDDAIILYYAWRHPGTPFFVRAALVAVLAYVVSPIDIVPDYLPVIGIADDVALIPAAIISLTHMLPSNVLAECRRESERWKNRMPWIIGLFIFLIVAWFTIIVAGLGYLIAK